MTLRPLIILILLGLLPRQAQAADLPQLPAEVLVQPRRCVDLQLLPAWEMAIVELDAIEKKVQSLDLGTLEPSEEASLRFILEQIAWARQVDRAADAACPVNHQDSAAHFASLDAAKLSHPMRLYAGLALGDASLLLDARQQAESAEEHFVIAMALQNAAFLDNQVLAALDLPPHHALAPLAYAQNAHLLANEGDVAQANALRLEAIRLADEEIEAETEAVSALIIEEIVADTLQSSLDLATLKEALLYALPPQLNALADESMGIVQERFPEHYMDYLLMLLNQPGIEAKPILTASIEALALSPIESRPALTLQILELAEQHGLDSPPRLKAILQTLHFAEFFQLTDESSYALSEVYAWLYLEELPFQSPDHALWGSALMHQHLPSEALEHFELVEIDELPPDFLAPFLYTALMSTATASSDYHLQRMSCHSQYALPSSKISQWIEAYEAQQPQGPLPVEATEVKLVEAYSRGDYDPQYLIHWIQSVDDPELASEGAVQVARCLLEARRWQAALKLIAPLRTQLSAKQRESVFGELDETFIEAALDFARASQMNQEPLAAAELIHQLQREWRLHPRLDEIAFACAELYRLAGEGQLAMRQYESIYNDSTASPLADDALFAAALLSQSSDELQVALELVERIIDEHPQGEYLQRATALKRALQASIADPNLEESP